MGAKLPQLDVLYQAGIDPKTGLPLKFTSGNKKCLKEDIKKALRIKDEQDAVNRYTWKNLPANITSQELERMIYYKGQLCFFYDKNLEEYYFLPYALNGTIDAYGRYNSINPVPWASGTDDKGNKAVAEYFAGLKLKCVYSKDIKDKEEDTSIYTVLLHDYTKQLAQTIIPRVAINDPLLDVMSNCIPYMNTALLLATGIEGIRVNDADQADDVRAANRSMENAALTGEPYVPITGNVEFQELNNGQVAKAEEYMLAMQSINNLRLSLYGLKNGGLFEKKAHELQEEADVNNTSVDIVMQDGLLIRQNFCEIANAIFGLNITCEVSESAVETAEENSIESEEETSETAMEINDGGNENA
ncbi:MAG: hypothetical protein J6W16_04065 [Methanobrevibacter sp.]|nr:hypothetical protein [Methanobrevibacter sp.]